MRFWSIVALPDEAPKLVGRNLPFEGALAIQEAPQFLRTDSQFLEETSL